jgi:hypothetical protein
MVYTKRDCVRRRRIQSRARVKCTSFGPSMDRRSPCSVVNVERIRYDVVENRSTGYTKPFRYFARVKCPLIEHTLQCC